MALGADQTNQPTTWCLLNTTISYILERTCRMNSQFLLLSRGWHTVPSSDCFA